MVLRRLERDTGKTYMVQVVQLRRPAVSQSTRKDNTKMILKKSRERHRENIDGSSGTAEKTCSILENKEG